MIKGIGIDLVEISRIQKSLDKGDGFKNLVFSKEEINYCTSKGNPIESFAGKFAAKEAFLKAIGSGWRGELNLCEIEILNNELGKPSLFVKGKSKSAFQEFNKCTVHVSISHTKNKATAIVIIEQDKQ